ncbi:uncharacterized protein BJ171DRAFT_471075 [Polychytrium aggregatum]|uniref:uncharacterized protein n=1 Tax=Polychytrium aggregatum TaxID=110093 RepID=UPI0022FF2411|nr:uncharacterized protein BJ171DRAFT_471075 [Polychytrium aggregatum]KAI9209435.1 hypothetical protein BJ171DRAFT_471075 [Polychytrium aggregatum]
MLRCSGDILRQAAGAGPVGLEEQERPVVQRHRIHAIGTGGHAEQRAAICGRWWWGPSNDEGEAKSAGDTPGRVVEDPTKIPRGSRGGEGTPAKVPPTNKKNAGLPGAESRPKDRRVQGRAALHDVDAAALAAGMGIARALLCRQRQTLAALLERKDSVRPFVPWVSAGTFGRDVLERPVRSWKPEAFLLFGRPGRPFRPPGLPAPPRPGLDPPREQASCGSSGDSINGSRSRTSSSLYRQRLCRLHSSARQRRAAPTRSAGTTQCASAADFDRAAAAF